jgi:hypothetical protein
MTDEERAGTPERYFGVVTIEGTRCGASGCCRVPVAAMPWGTREEPQPLVVWFCTVHAEAVLANVRRKDGTVVYVERTCRQEVDGVRCGALATHLAIVGVRGPQGEPLLRLVSVCGRHLPADDD